MDRGSYSEVKYPFICLSGLPRSGATLLSSILSENPLIHAEGNSAVCQLMWDMQESCEINSREQLLASNRFELQHNLISSIPDIYYGHVDKPIVLDKCRSWTMPSNMQMLRQYITNSPKVIVMTRPIQDIIESFKFLYIKNNKPFQESVFRQKGSEPLMRSCDGVDFAKANNTGEFLFVDYDDLISDTNKELKRIYSFLEMDIYQHDLQNIVNHFPENDLVYGLDGMHTVRKTISRRSL